MLFDVKAATNLACLVTLAALFGVFNVTADQCSQAGPEGGVQKGDFAYFRYFRDRTGQCVFTPPNGKCSDIGDIGMCSSSCYYTSSDWSWADSPPTLFNVILQGASHYPVRNAECASVADRVS